MYLYGAGYNGEIALELFKITGHLDLIEGFIDSNPKKTQLRDYRGIPIYPPTVLKDASDKEIIVTTGEKYAKEILDIISSYGINRVVFYDEIVNSLFPQYKLFNRYWEDYEVSKTVDLFRTHNLIYFLALCVGQACSLKCKQCSNLAPFSDPGHMRYKIEDLKSDLKRFSENIDFLFELQIQGGEPFLYSDLPELLLYAKSLNKFGMIQIATNGTMMPNEEFWRTAKEIDNLCIRISHYPNCDNSAALKAACEKNEIKCVVYEFQGKSGEWIELGTEKTIYELNEYSSLYDKYTDCPFASCLTMEDGIIARCSRAINSERVLGFGHLDNDYINIRESANLRESIKEYYCNPKEMEACAYCRGGTGRAIIPAEQ